MSNGNNREFPFVVVASVVNFEATLPMSANRVQFLKTSTKIVYILESVHFFTVSLSHQRATGASKHATSQK